VSTIWTVYAATGSGWFASPKRLVSTGADGTVQIWNCEGLVRGDEPSLVRTVRCDMFEPHNIQFKPGESLLAIEGSDGYVYLLKDRPGASVRLTGLPLAPNVGHQTVDMTWGRDVSSHILFASSAAHDGNDTTGFHKAFDADKGKLICEFDAQEAGQRVTIDETGHRLMIATEGVEDSYFLRQYDARRHIKKTQQKVSLEPFVGSGRAEVNRLSFSSDGTYLAVPRSDNTTHVYDGRYLSRGPLHIFAHDGGTTTLNNRYGIVEVAWVDGALSDFGLISGGIDGSVRIWDVRKASNDLSNGKPIVECDYDIGNFALGDIQKGEKALVVGELSGRVTIFDHIKRS